MAKLSRRKRKELAEKAIEEKNLKKDRRKTPNEDGYISKRSYSCWEHEYQLDENGDYVCSICGYRTKDLSAENAFQEYFSSRTYYRISEIRELMQGLRKVSWYRNTRGQKMYYPIEAVDDVCGVMLHFGMIYFIFDFEDDGKFPELDKNMLNKKWTNRENVLDIRSEDYLELLQTNWKPDKVWNRYSAEGEGIEHNQRELRKRVQMSHWYCKTTDGKTYLYDVWKEILVESSLDEVECEFLIKQYVYGKENQLEEIIYRDQDVTYSLCN